MILKLPKGISEEFCNVHLVDPAIIGGVNTRDINIAARSKRQRHVVHRLKIIAIVSRGSRRHCANREIVPIRARSLSLL